MTSREVLPNKETNTTRSSRPTYDGWSKTGFTKVRQENTLVPIQKEKDVQWILKMLKE